LARYYKACDVFVLPSLQEAQALAAMEAMWFSKPVIVTNAIVSAEETVDHGVNGFIVNPHSTLDLTQRLESLAADAELRLNQGQASRKRANTYRPELVMEALEEAYTSLVPKAQTHFFHENLSFEKNH
jgi:1,2-diacylglycerol 3-alpha-glucosyltransferase